MSTISGSCSETASQRLFEQGIEINQQQKINERKEERLKQAEELTSRVQASNPSSQTSLDLAEGLKGLHVDILV